MKKIISIMAGAVLVFLPVFVLAQPALPELPPDSLLQDPESADFSNDIFFDDTATTTDTSTATDNTSATTATDTTTAADNTPATTTVTDTASGSETNLVFGLAAIMAFITLLIFKSAKPKPRRKL